MRELSTIELEAVSGGNSTNQVSVVRAVNKSVSVKQVTVQQNGDTLVRYKRVKRY
jgi:hypothetical protein